MASAPIGATRTCTMCRQEMPATLDFFNRHKAGRFGLRPRCKPCEKIDRDARLAMDPDYWKRHWAKTKDHKNADRRANSWRHGPNREKRMETERLWRDENRERIRKLADAWRKPRQQEINTRQREIYHKDEARRASRDAYGKEWRTNNRDKARSYVRNRRARIKGVGGRHTAIQIQQVLAEQKGLCRYCFEPLTAYHVDHVIPIARGGSNDISNIVLACPPCNQSKADKLLSEWQPRFHPPE